MEEVYVEPQKGLQAFICPHCHTMSQVEFVTYKFQSDVRAARSGVLTVENELYVAKCECCGRKIIWLGNQYLYPEACEIIPNKDMPVSVKSLFEEAGTIYMRSPRAACALLRLAIDKLCHELGETDRDININIGALVKKGLSPSIQKALDIVRVVGNKAVHPGQIDIDVENKETAVALMKLVNLITYKMISEPKEIDDLFEKLPETAKQSIEKRDYS